MDELCVLLDNSLDRWFLALATIVGVWFGIQIGRRFIVKKLEASTHHGVIFAITLDFLKKTHQFFIFILALFCGLNVFHLGPKINFIVNKTIIVAAVIQLGIWLHFFLSYALEQAGIKNRVESKLAKGAINTIDTILHVFLWSVILILILGNLGVEIGPLIAGLGIGGIAIALGIQSTLQNIAASLSILIDKPFMAGDFIIVDGYMGTVDCVGIKTTRVKSLSGEQIVFSNNDLLNSRIRNYKQMKERRILFSFKVPYDTPYKKAENIPHIVKKVIEPMTNVRFERAHLKELGEYAFEFEVVYHVLSSDYGAYMDAQQQINLALIEQFENEGIAFAFPRYDVALNKNTP